MREALVQAGLPVVGSSAMRKCRLVTPDNKGNNNYRYVNAYALLYGGDLRQNVEMKPGKGGQIARSAGSSVQLVAKDDPYGVLRLPSGEMRRVPLTCRATIGQVGNVDHSNITGGKAGRSRWRGKRPTVRGSAMNPVDHPHGGGEGRTSGGRHPVSPWGKPTKGSKTRSNKSTDKFIVASRHARKKKG